MGVWRCSLHFIHVMYVIDFTTKYRTTYKATSSAPAKTFCYFLVTKRKGRKIKRSIIDDDKQKTSHRT